MNQYSTTIKQNNVYNKLNYFLYNFIFTFLIIVSHFAILYTNLFQSTFLQFIHD